MEGLLIDHCNLDYAVRNIEENSNLTILSLSTTLHNPSFHTFFPSHHLQQHNHNPSQHPSTQPRLHHSPPLSSPPRTHTHTHTRKWSSYQRAFFRYITHGYRTQKETPHTYYLYGPCTLLPASSRKFSFVACSCSLARNGVCMYVCMYVCRYITRSYEMHAGDLSLFSTSSSLVGSASRWGFAVRGFTYSAASM